MAATTSPKAQPLPKWQSITLPLIAGLLHLQVFYYAAVHCIFRAYFKSSSNDVISSDEFRNECFLLDRAIFMAYVFDLLCCYFKVIPFSSKFMIVVVVVCCNVYLHFSYLTILISNTSHDIKPSTQYIIQIGCNCSRDIIGHHVPTLLMALPLAIPLWSGTNYLRKWEITSFDILENTTNDEQLRTHFINSYTLASGFAYISSLNEVFMCFQRVEMSLAGVHSFRDIPSMSKRKRFFTSHSFCCIHIMKHKLLNFQINAVKYGVQQMIEWTFGGLTNVDESKKMAIVDVIPFLFDKVESGGDHQHNHSSTIGDNEQRDEEEEQHDDNEHRVEDRR